MRTKVQMWGNSLAVRIPKPFADELGVSEESEVELELVDDQLVLSRSAVGSYSLEALLGQITEENLHEEIGTGESVGREVW